MRWELANSIDKEYIIELAKIMGWAENKIQVRRTKGLKEDWYSIEPYDECNCPDILYYGNYKEKERNEDFRMV